MDRGHGPVDMRTFEHENTEIYGESLDLMKQVAAIRDQLPATRVALVDGLDRAAAAVVLNVANGGSELPGVDKAQYYRVARRATTECAALLDIATAVHHLDANDVAAAKHRLRRMAAILAAMGEWADDFAPASHLQ